MTNTPIDPNIDQKDLVRLSAQNTAILNRLRQGPATNAELAGIALKYTGRISDLRANGFEIRCVRSAGTSTYTLAG